MSLDYTIFGYTYAHWLEEVDDALKFITGKTFEEAYSDYDLQSLWSIGQTPGEAAQKVIDHYATRVEDQKTAVRRRL